MYLETRQYIEESASDVIQPTKRQVGDWLKGEKGFQRQKTTGAALPKHKPVAIIRRSRPLQYIQKTAEDPLVLPSQVWAARELIQMTHSCAAGLPI